MRSGTEPAEGVPAFLAKLWKLVDEPRSNHLISWGQGGHSFVIKNQTDFARKLLPLYYKHNNMASFIRQLNMYGFHKVVSVDTGSLKCENEEIQFTHPCFLKGHPYLLKHIKRKIAGAKTAAGNEEKALLKPETMTKVLTDVKHMKGKQESLDARFCAMKHENEALWREVAVLRQKHTKQQQIVNNLIQFFMSLVQNSRNGPLKTGVKRQYRLMINDAAHNSEEENRGSKSPRLDSDNEQEDDAEFILPELDEDEGPIIHEVGDHDHMSEGGLSNSFSAIKSELLSSPAGGTSSTAPSPAPSTIPEAFDVAMDEIDDSAINSLFFEIPSDLPNAFSPMRAQTASPLVGVDPGSVLMDNQGASLGSGQKTSKKALTDKIRRANLRRSTPSPAFTLTSTQASATLPTNIFDSDETNSQDESAIMSVDAEKQSNFSDFNEDSACEPADVDIINSLDLIADPNLSSTRSKEKNKSNSKKSKKATEGDGYVGNIAQGSYNSNVCLNSGNTGSKGKSKSSNGKLKDIILQNMKEEIPSLDDDSYNMTLATLSSENTRPTLTRFNSVPLRDYSTQQYTERKMKKYPGTTYIKEDVDDHLVSMQSDIENLRELLSGDYSLDANTLLGLFGQHEEPFYGLSMPNSSDAPEKTKEPADESNQLITYVPPISSLGFDDFELDDGPGEQTTEELRVSPLTATDTLNTPQVQLMEPRFP